MPHSSNFYRAVTVGMSFLWQSCEVVVMCTFLCLHSYFLCGVDISIFLLVCTAFRVGGLSLKKVKRILGRQFLGSEKAEVW